MRKVKVFDFHPCDPSIVCIKKMSRKDAETQSLTKIFTANYLYD